jgi:hypothetical protein
MPPLAHESTPANRRDQRARRHGKDDPGRGTSSYHPAVPGSRYGELEALLAEQVAYYRAVAPEYEDHAHPYVGPSATALPGPFLWGAGTRS